MKILSGVLLVCLAAVLMAADVNLSDLPGSGKVSRIGMNSKDRTNNKYGAQVTELPKFLEQLQMISVPRGVANQPGIGYTFTIDKPATVYMLVEDHGKTEIPAEWKLVEKEFVSWKYNMVTGKDLIYSRKYPAGKVEIPIHKGLANNRYGIPNAALVKADE